MDLFDEELELWKQRAADSPGFEGTVADAWNSELDVAKLLPFFCAFYVCSERKPAYLANFHLAFAWLWHHGFATGLAWSAWLA